LTITYDGIDGVASGVNTTTGLGDINMNGTGSFITQLNVDGIGSGKSVTVTFRVYSDATHWSDGSITFTGPASNPTYNISIPQSAFVTGSGAAGAADFSSVNAVQLILSSNQNGLDVTFSNGISVPCAGISITGSVFNDVNGNTIINGGESFTTLPAPMYVYLVDASGIVVDSANVLPNGSYTLTANPSQTYTIELSTDPYPIGTNVNTTPIDNTPPTGWATTGENGDANSGFGDLNPNGILTVIVGTTNLTNKNFGITCTVNAGIDYTLNICQNDVSVVDMRALTGGQTGGTWTRVSGTGGTFNAGAGTFTIQPTPTTTSVFRYVVTASAPCTNDTALVTFNVKPVPVREMFVNRCVGDSVCFTNPVTLATVCYKEAGVYYDTLTTAAANGCDSIVITNLAFFPATSVTLSSYSGNTCSSDAITINDNTFEAAEVTIDHDGAGTLSSNYESSSPFSFTYTPSPSDQGNVVTITFIGQSYYPSGVNCGDQATATYELTVDICTVLITGNVFNDVNGNTVINSGDIAVPTTTPMYVYLVDSITGLVVATANVDPTTGAYELSATPNTTYNIYLSTEVYSIGHDNNTTAINTTPPADWVTIGENGDNNTGTGDESPNGILTVRTEITDVDNQNFALAPIPVADDKTYLGLDPQTTRFLPTNNTTYPNSMPLNNVAGSIAGIVSLVDGTLPGNVTGTDLNAGPIGATAGANNSLTFVTDGVVYDPNSPTTPLTNSVLVYTFEGQDYILNPNPIATDPSYVFWNPTKGQYEVPQFNPNNLNVWFDTGGQTGFVFDYGWINEAGVQGEPATFVVNATGPLAVLPVELTSFEVIVASNDVQLTWTTASEKNNDRFEIERSTDGINFVKVGTVKGNGTTSLPQLYNFTDVNPGVGVHYYRLKQVDFDTQFEYSKIKSAEIVGTVTIRTYPNPAQNILNIEVTDTRLGEINGSIVLYNAAGAEMIKESMVGSNRKQLDVSQLPSGSYLLRYQSEEMISTFKVIITH
jgi:hypothetical protein